ncbi:MAG: hypothetical protein V4654_01025 [Bdellovibrionota bacterium]
MAFKIGFRNIKKPVQIYPVLKLRKISLMTKILFYCYPHEHETINWGNWRIDILSLHLKRISLGSSE